VAALNLGIPNEEEAIWDELRLCAKETMPLLVRHELSSQTNKALVSAIDIKTDPAKDDQAAAVAQSIENSFLRLQQVRSSALSQQALIAREAEIRAQLTQSIADGTWVSNFRGREILKRFVTRANVPVSYEVFRNLLLAQMHDDSYRPAGMAEIVNRIVNA
jgi:hypothetical protein